MSVYSYEIGATSGGMTNLESLAGLKRAPRSVFTLFPTEYVGGDGRTVGDGLPACKWIFDSLSQAQLNVLRNYVASGLTYVQSAQVYIKTRLDDGTYATFLGWMHWPRDFEDKRVPGNYYLGLEITFTNLVQQ